MESTKSVWAFVVALAAVVNGLGIVHLISAAAQFLKKRQTMHINVYWVYVLMTVFQLLIHALLWWSILGLRGVDEINFLSYMYLLIGPTLLFLATSFLLPDTTGDPVDTRVEYYQFRIPYYSTLSLFWVWAIFLWPVFGYPFAPTVKMLMAWLAVSVVLRFTDNPKVHAVLTATNCLIFAAFVAIFALKLGAVGAQMTG